MCPSFGGTTGGSGHRDGSAKGWLREHRRHCRRPCGPVIIVGWWAGPWGASQSPQPHLEDCSTYYPLRPTNVYGRYHHLQDVARQPFDASRPLDSRSVMCRGGATEGASSWL